MDISKRDIILPASVSAVGGPCQRRKGNGPYIASVVLGVLSAGVMSASVRQIQVWVASVAHKKVSRNCVHRELTRLIKEGYIDRVYCGSYQSRKASSYRLTRKYQVLFKQSGLYYHSLSDIFNRKGSFTNEDQTIQSLPTGQCSTADSYHDAWRGMLPESADTDQFIAALKGLEDNQLCFRRLDALREADSLNGLHTTYPLKQSEFNVAYRPIATGRLQSVPHTYIGKDLSQFLRPAEDPGLRKGFLFSLDYGQQELRLLAHFCQDSVLLQYANDSGNMFNQMIGQFHMHKSIKECGKQAIYSFIYGSDGWALKEALDKLHGFNPKHLEYARTFGKELRRLFPCIEYFQHDLESGLYQDGFITAPGGVVRIANAEPDAITKKGAVSKKWVRRIALSHAIQGSGAWITRKVVAAAVNLKRSRLFMPVHDGFIFYSQSDKPREAVLEATRLMESCAKEVAPYVLFPVKLEWKVGRYANNI